MRVFAALLESLYCATLASLCAVCCCLPDITEGKAQLQLARMTHRHCQLVGWAQAELRCLVALLSGTDVPSCFVLPFLCRYMMCEPAEFDVMSPWVGNSCHCLPMLYIERYIHICACMPYEKYESRVTAMRSRLHAAPRTSADMPNANVLT